MRAAALTVLLAGVFCWPAPAAAQELQPFVPGSYQRIVQGHAGKPFVLAMWSLTCAPCHDELALFGRLLKAHPHFDLVLVSTDSPAETAALRTTLRRHQIARAENWVFADGFEEKLRFEIDRKWYGELPRTYFFQADGTARARSGRVDAATIEAWLAATQSR